MRKLKLPNFSSINYASLAKSQIFRVALFTLQLTVSYILMLIFMTYSVWFGAAVVLGLTTGFYTFNCSVRMM